MSTFPMSTPEESIEITPAQFAKHLEAKGVHVSARHIRRWCDKEIIPARRMIGGWLIEPEAALRAMNKAARSMSRVHRQSRRRAREEESVRRALQRFFTEHEFPTIKTAKKSEVLRWAAALLEAALPALTGTPSARKARNRAYVWLAEAKTSIERKNR